MKKNERTIQYFDLDIKGKTYALDIKGTLPSPRNLQELMGDFEFIREANLARKMVSTKAKQEYRLEHMEELDHCWVLLLNVVDPEVAHPVIQKINGIGTDRQYMDLGIDKGLESSVHIIIYKKINTASKHLMLLEKSDAFPYQKVISFLNHLCRISSKNRLTVYTCPHPSGVEGKTIRKYCSLSILGHPSEDFKRELESGKITGIKLTSGMNVVHGYDSNAYPELIGTDIKMKVGLVDVLRSGGNWGHLKKALRYADSLDSPMVRISFTDLTGASHTTILNTDTGGFVNADKYIKKRKISGFSGPLRTAFPFIHDDIKDKMLGLVK